MGLAHGIHFDLLLVLFGGLSHRVVELIDSSSPVRDSELLLLVCHCFPLALPGTGVVLGPLSTEGQTKTVTNAACASNVHQSLDVHLDFRTKLTFNADTRDDLANFSDLVVRPILDALVFRDSGLSENVRSSGASNAVDVSQGNYSSFVAGDIDTGDTCHSKCVLTAGLTLALLEFGVLLVDDEESSFSSDDLAVRGADFKGCTGLHNSLFTYIGTKCGLWSNRMGSCPHERGLQVES